jgi:cytochrome c-type biogenesis protein CcmH/NrfG
VIIFGVHSFIDWTWFVPGTVVMALLAAGWVAGRGPWHEMPVSPEGIGERLRAGARRPFRVAAACLVLALAIATAWTAWQPQRSVDTGNRALAALDAAPKDRGAFDRARALASQARDRNPLSIEPLYEMAVIETLAGRKDAAHDALVAAVRLQPANPSTWLRLAEFAVDQQDDPKLALRLLGPAVHLDPRSPAATAIYLNALRRATEQKR